MLKTTSIQNIIMLVISIGKFNSKLKTHVINIDDFTNQSLHH